MTNTISLYENYSTTRLLTQEKPIITKTIEDTFKRVLFLSKNDTRKGEYRLRIKDYSLLNPSLTTVVVLNGEAIYQPRC